MAFVLVLGAAGQTAWSEQEKPAVPGAPGAPVAPVAAAGPAAPATAADPAASAGNPAAPAAAASNPARPPAGALTAAGLAQRWEAIGNLLERSSAAKHIEKDGSAESKQFLQEARSARARAKEAIDANELEKGDGLLREAAKLIFKAERASRSPEMGAEKAKREFIAQRDSVQALMQTGRRVAGEKNATKPEFAQAEALLKEADKSAAEGKHAEGRIKLDQAYGLITTAVRSLREGESIRDDKKFETKADEFKYEQARNDDYQGLIGGLVEGKDSSWTDMANLGKSLRDEADGLARAANHEAALEKIKESTNKLKSVLRRAGFPIL